MLKSTDNGTYKKPRQALAYFRQAYTIRPAVVRKVWYKLALAAGGSIDLSGLFIGFRQMCRSIQHRLCTLVVDAHGPYWQTD